MAHIDEHEIAGGRLNDPMGHIPVGDQAGPPTRVDVVVVGGGLAGLAAAAVAAGQGAQVVLLDAHPLGGRARSDERRGFTFNRGPHALYLGGVAESVLRELGVAMEGAPPPLTGGMGQLGDRVDLLPAGATSLTRTKLLKFSEKAAFAKAFVRLPKLDPHAWVGRPVTELRDELGLRGAAGQLVEALVRLTTYVNAPDTMDAGAALANVQQGTSTGVTYLHGGFQSLVDGLARVAAERGVDVRPGVPVSSARPGPDGRWQVSTGATEFDAAAVVMATGTPDSSAALLGQRPESWDALGPPVTAACLDLGLRRPPAKRFILGIDEPLYFSMHAPAARLAPDGQSVVHVMRYQPAGDDMPTDQQEAQLWALASAAGIEEADVVEKRFLARLVVTGGYPTAAAGGLDGRPSVEVDGHPGLLIAGDWVGGEGMLSDASLASGRTAGRLAAARASKIPVA